MPVTLVHGAMEYSNKSRVRWQAASDGIIDDAVPIDA